jgi:PAS domain-containing protein
MEHEHHHEELIRGASKESELLLKKSAQAVYIYLDDTHKFCNERFAKLLGYKSAREWAAMETPLDDVAEANQDEVVSAYEKATEKFVASCLDIAVRNVKTNKLIKTRMIMAPLVYHGHVFAIHFLSEI